MYEQPDYELTDQDLYEAYLDALGDGPPNDWRDTLTIALQAESDIEMALRRAPITVPALVGFGAPRKPAGVASIGNGLYVRTGRRV